MNTCKHCKFWSRQYEGACDKITLIPLGWTWNKPSNSAVIQCEVWDDSGLEVQLLTAADFSCSMFQGKKG